MFYDIAVDLLKHLSTSLTFLKPYATLLGVIVLLLRQNNIKKIINGRLPKKYRDTQSSDIYDMMRDIRDIKAHLGVAARAEPIVSTEHKYQRFLKWLKIRRRKKIMSKLKSRKLWMALLAAVLPVINDQFGLGFNTETIIAAIGAIVAYILGEAHVDAKRAKTASEEVPAGEKKVENPDSQNYSH